MSSDDIFDKGDPKRLYNVLGQIGAGSYGNVFKAQDKKTQEFVALKVMTPEEPEDLEETVNEVALHRTLTHPNVVSFYGAWKRGKEVSIALELCESGSARDLFARVGFRPVPEAVISPIARGLLAALHYLHDRLVMHRDIKAADFGVSCRLASRTDRRRSLIGTPHWLAPEVLAVAVTNLPYDIRADIWSVGITMIELAEGRPPLWDLDATSVIIEVPRRSPAQLRDPAAHSPAFCDFTHACLSKSPSARPDVAKLRAHPWIMDAKSGPADLIAYVEKTRQGAAAFAAQVAAAPAAVHVRPSRRQSHAMAQQAAQAAPAPPPTHPGAIEPALSSSPPPPAASLAARPLSQQSNPISVSPAPSRPLSVQAPERNVASPPLSSSPPNSAPFSAPPPGFSPTFSAPVSPRKISIPPSLAAPPSLTELAVKPVPVASPAYALKDSAASVSSSSSSLTNSSGAVQIPTPPPTAAGSAQRTPSPSPPTQTSPLSSPKTSPRFFRNTGVFNPALPAHVTASPLRERGFSGPAPPIAGMQRGEGAVEPLPAAPRPRPHRRRQSAQGTGGAGPYVPIMGLQRLSPARARPAGISSPPPLAIPLSSLASNNNPNPNPNPVAAPPPSASVALHTGLVTPQPLSGSSVFATGPNAPPSPRSNYTMMPDMVRSVVPTPQSPRAQHTPVYAPAPPRSNYEFLPDVAAPAPPASSSLLLNLPSLESLAQKPARKISQSSPANLSASPSNSPRPLGPTLPRGSRSRPPLPSWVALFIRCGIEPDRASAYERIFLSNEMELEQMRDLTESILHKLAVAPDDVTRIMNTLNTLAAS